MRNFYLLVVLLFSALVSRAQTTGFSGTGGNIDVDNYQIWWRINPDSSLGIKGIVKIKFKTVVANVTSVSFDLRSVHVIDNVTWNGSSVTPSKTGNTFSVPVNIPTVGTRDSITITYHGVPPLGSGAATGFTKTTSGGNNVIYTLSESYEDRDWWPCKADMQDKADTVDITVNVPWRTNNAIAASATDTFWAACNGTLIDSTIDLSGTQAQRNRTFKYINRYPMASYLVFLGVARYTRYYQGTVPIGGFNVPVVYYLYAGKTAGTYTTIVGNMDKATECLAAFSNKFGDYGFIDPAKGGKHGFVEGCVSGTAMEHQTFSSFATNTLTGTGAKDVMIHELQHQWFGDKVTFATWNDLWLAEGFAEYGPALARELVSGLGSSAYTYRSGFVANAQSETVSARIPNSSIGNSDQIWGSQYGSSVYQRGATIVSMIRTIMGDTKYFQMMTDYQTRAGLQYKSATTDSLKNVMTAWTGIDMTPFFNDNVVGTGYANYTIGYQKFGSGNKKLALSVVGQTRNNQAVNAYITGPVLIHVKGALPANDTTIVFYDWGGGVLSKAGNGVGAKTPGNALTYQLSFTPTSLVYDDSARIISTGTMSALTIVDLKIKDFSARQHTGYNDATLILDDNSINADVILERSGDGVNFTDLGSMALQASAGGTTKKYLFNDMSPLAKDNYYRARYKNADGIDIYSRIVKLGSLPVKDYVILNNPVSDLLQVKTSDAAGKDLSLSVYDASGKQILGNQVKKAGYITDVKLPALAPGVYVLRIAVDGEESKNIRFIVK